jgi:hypothetical protein
MARIILLAFIHPGVGPVGGHERTHVLRVLPELQVVGAGVGIHEIWPDHLGVNRPGRGARCWRRPQAVALKVVVIQIIPGHSALQLCRPAVDKFCAAQKREDADIFRGVTPRVARRSRRPLITAVIIFRPRRMQIGSQAARLRVGRPARLIICPRRLRPIICVRQNHHFAAARRRKWSRADFRRCSNPLAHPTMKSSMPGMCCRRDFAPN